jgi:Uma2 family endonuclease
MTRVAPRLHRYTFREYLTLEEDSTVKHEFLDGEIYAMAGGTPEHAALAAAVTIALGSAARGGPCTVHSSDLRVRALPNGLVTYPDVTVVCGGYERDPESSVTVVNPSIVVEVTSESTQDYDRGDKLATYQRIASLAAVVLVSHRERLVEVIERADETPGGWRRSEARRGGRVRVPVLATELVVDEIYAAAPAIR